MHDARGELSIVFNGEIYNFAELRRELVQAGQPFCSQSDTEVILAAYRAWGTGCLSRMNGMFAFALYDNRHRSMFLARDRAGEKPLFYTLDHGVLRFASELKALLADPSMPRSIDPDALDCYLAMGFVPGDRSILKEAKKLPPAHALCFDLHRGEARIWRYWQLPEFSGGGEFGRLDEGVLVDELQALLEDAVRRQLVADVPIGILLSGGVDSSLVTAVAARAQSRVKTFTVRFPGHDSHDETAHARLIAKHFGTEHVELDSAEAGVELLPLLARQFDEPIVDSSMIPTHLVSRLVRQHCTVALGGDGGDELFGGYGHYSRLVWMHQNTRWIPRSARRLVARAAEAVLPVGFKGRNWLQGLELESNGGVPLIASYFDRSTRRRLIRDQPDSTQVAERIRRDRTPQTGDLLQRATRLDFENYLPEDILVKVDRASMLNSLEVRAPFLDYRLTEFAFGKVPSNLKATSTTWKVLLKRLAARVLPPMFDRDRKQGFSIPLASWLRSGPWKAFFRDVLLGSDSTLFDRETVNTLFAGQAKGRSNSERLFALVLFELWRREYRCELR